MMTMVMMMALIFPMLTSADCPLSLARGDGPRQGHVTPGRSPSVRVRAPVAVEVRHVMAGCERRTVLQLVRPCPSPRLHPHRTSPGSSLLHLRLGTCFILLRPTDGQI